MSESFSIFLYSSELIGAFASLAWTKVDQQNCFVIYFHCDLIFISMMKSCGWKITSSLTSLRMKIKAHFRLLSNFSTHRFLIIKSFARYFFFWRYGGEHKVLISALSLVYLIQSRSQIMKLEGSQKFRDFYFVVKSK